MNFLDIGELYKPIQKERQDRLDTFNSVLARCHARIKTVAHQGRQQECTIDIPQFIPGTPPYRLEELIPYLEGQLRHNGFRVLKIPPNHLYVSWKPTDIDYEQYQKSHEEHRRLIAMREHEQRERDQARRTAIENELKEYDEPVRKKGGKRAHPTGLDHVAMVGYDDLINDMVPVNRNKLRAIREQPERRKVKPGFRGPPKGSVYPFNPF